MSAPFFGGVPTQPDVDKLLAKWPELPPKTVISYAEIESVIGSKSGSCRYKTVVSRWRRYLEQDRNIIMRCLRSQAYEVLDANSRIDHSSDGVKQGKRKLFRAARVALSTPAAELDEERRSTHDYIMRVQAALSTVEATKPKALGPIHNPKKK